MDLPYPQLERQINPSNALLCRTAVFVQGKILDYSEERSKVFGNLTLALKIFWTERMPNEEI